MQTDKEIDQLIGKRIREERQRLKLNQTEFGEIAGVLKGAQVNYENGSRSPKANYLAKIAKVGVDINYILTGEVNIKDINTIEKELIQAYRRVKEFEMVFVISDGRLKTFSPKSSVSISDD